MFIVCYDYNNERSEYVEKCSNISCATLLVKIIAKYLRCKSNRLQMFFKVSLLKKVFNPAILLKKDSNTRIFM